MLACGQRELRRREGTARRPAVEGDVETLIHLGFTTTASNYSHGNLVKAVVFQGLCSDNISALTMRST